MQPIHDEDQYVMVHGETKKESIVNHSSAERPAVSEASLSTSGPYRTSRSHAVTLPLGSLGLSEDFNSEKESDRRKLDDAGCRMQDWMRELEGTPSRD